MLFMRQHEKCTTALLASESFTDLILVWFWFFVFFPSFYLFLSPFLVSFDLYSLHSVNSSPYLLVFELYLVNKLNEN